MKTLRISAVFLVLTGLLIVGIVYAASVSRQAPVYPSHDFTGGPTYSVQRVIDGDTVILNMDRKSVRVRLIGVDTPETVHPSKPVQAYGKEASNFLTNLLKGEKVYVESKPDEKTDEYGRALFYLYRAPDGLFVNLEIVRQGYGHAYTHFPFKHMELFRYYEREARKAARGLWDTQSNGESDLSERTRVSLLAPYRQPYRDAPTDKLSVQYAVKELARQAGYKYDWNTSHKNTTPVCQQWIQPTIIRQPLQDALRHILSPLGLSYVIQGDTITLTREGISGNTINRINPQKKSKPKVE